MVILKLFELQDANEERPLTIFSQGKHIIGRDLLKLKDKRVSRNHAEISITEDTAELVSTHINPCFFIAAQGNTVTTITQNKSGVVLNDGDKFAFLPSDHWFKIRFDNDDAVDGLLLLNQEDVIGTSNDDANCSNKRSNSEERQVKRLKIDEMGSNGIQPAEVKQEPLEDGINPDTSTNSNQNLTQIDNTRADVTIKAERDGEPCDSTANLQNVANVTSSEVVKVEPENSAEPKVETTDNMEKENENESNKEEDNEKDPNKPSCSTDDQKVKSRRERCWYGMNCYRKNPQHRDNVSHPGDSDFESDPEDDRPECPYGAACYRRNLLHRRQLKHPGPPAPKPSKSTVNVRVNAGCPFCAHCKGTHRKPDYESDYDDDDYFYM